MTSLVANFDCFLFSLSAVSFSLKKHYLQNISFSYSTTKNFFFLIFSFSVPATKCSCGARKNNNRLTELFGLE